MPSSGGKDEKRLVSLDAHRGFIMFALVSGYFGLSIIPEILGDQSALGAFFKYETSHVLWTGCSLWDLIQPSFMFIVGVALPFSYASRKRQGESERRIFAHTIKRAIILILIGLVLRSKNHAFTYFTFEDVVQQIGLGYVFLYLMRGRGIRIQCSVAAAVMVGYWALFALWPLPPATFDAAAAGLPAHWAQFSGFAAHWNSGANPAGYFDQWFLNLFPRGDGPWTFHVGGYATLNFIPSFVTMLFGLMTGELMRSDRALSSKCAILVKAGLGCLAFGLAVDGHLWPFVDWQWSIAPVVKRIWTPSFAVFSTGWVLLSLAFFVWIVDIKGYQRWTFPFLVFGANSMAIYIMHEMLQGWIFGRIDAHFQLVERWGDIGYLPTWLLTIGVLWYICYWMYKRKVFIRI